MNRLKQFIHRYALSDATPLEAKMLNITFLCGITSSSVAVITRIITGASPYLILVVLAIIVCSGCLLYVSNRFHLYTACTWISLILLCDILLPAAYFFLGGVAGSSAAYFALGLVLIFLLSGGKSTLVLGISHVIVAIICYYLNYRYPNLVTPVGDFLNHQDLRIYLDHIQSFLIVGGCIGVIIKFQNIVYRKEKEKEDLFNRKLLQQDKLRQGVNKVAAVLFASGEDRFQDSMKESMEILARCIDVDRMFIWESRIIDGTQRYKPIFQWVNNPALQVSETPGFSSGLIKDNLDWYVGFSKGLSANGPLHSLPTALRDHFAPYGAVSTLGIPVILQDRVWGFVSFDDCRQERYFSAFEDDILRSGVMLLANAVIHHEMTQSLIKAKEEALAGTKAKSDFLARMSHEIRTPLNAILGLSEVELQNDLAGETRTNLEKIYNSGFHLLEIINDILDISKIGSGNFGIIPAEYDFPGPINDAVQFNVLRIGSKQIEFRLELDETIPRKLYGDELRIKQILNNLLSNAFKYTEEGEVRLLVSWERRGDDAWLAFAVEDTGRGIKKEDLEKIFSEYAQFNMAANRRIEGTGLGLSITHGLVQMMGGTITAESEYGKGSVFRVSLPQKIVDPKPIGRDIAENLRNFRFIEDRNRGRGNSFIRSYMPYGKVLVVDDLQTNLDVTKGLLMPYGLQVDAVLSGQEAVERVRAEEARYDLIFMDHMMPEMDGIEATRIIRNEIGSPYARNVVIIALTANAVEGNREMLLENGFNDFVSKPIDIKQLDMVLNRWIRDKQSAATLQEAEDQNLAPPKSRGGFGGGQIDGHGSWLLAHPTEGINFEAALRLYGNSGAAYMPILKSFVTHTPPLLERMDAHLESSLQDYAIEAHGLKGTCNAICAGAAADLARELEFASKEGNLELVRRKHGELCEKVMELTERLRALLGEWEAGQPEEEKKERRPEPGRELLARLSAASGTFNSNDTEEILGELERYRYEEGEELIRWLREQAENFDYDAMHKRLEEFLDSRDLS
ncbi:MAG: response regulator [Treponema sp.]|jgi:signal transduction histidine kinase/FixJ family two-component response regulator/HPt (histidine-containing phosphotransfer) domain-containing protein|nr:response regulator [Treponema sp.]